MKIIDLSGTIHTGMWSYDPPYPNFELKPIPQPDWVEQKVYMENFNGMCGQTGTYLETPAHFFGYKESYPLIDVDISKLINMRTYMIKLELEDLPESGGRRAITRDKLLENADKELLKGCDAVLVSTGWGKKWRSPDFIKSSPFMKYDAMDFLIESKPFLLGSDSPMWENPEKPEGFFPNFFKADILMLAPCVNLEAISKEVVTMTALPLKVEGACVVPCRAFVME
jgi:kynurenine formamidase